MSAVVPMLNLFIAGVLAGQLVFLWIDGWPARRLWVMACFGIANAVFGVVKIVALIGAPS